MGVVPVSAGSPHIKKGKSTLEQELEWEMEADTEAWVRKLLRLCQLSAEWKNHSD